MPITSVSKILYDARNHFYMKISCQKCKVNAGLHDGLSLRVSRRIYTPRPVAKARVLRPKR